MAMEYFRFTQDAAFLHETYPLVKNALGYLQGLRAELEKIAAECGVSDRVQFLGWIDNKSDLLKETLARAGVFASMSRFESFGISAAEAVVSGCRVVLSDIPAHRQFTAFGAELVPLEDGEAREWAASFVADLGTLEGVDNPPAKGRKAKP